METIEQIAAPIEPARKSVGLGRTAFYELINQREIETIKVGKRRLVVLRSLRDFVERKTKEAA